jgi:hypothetical protein
MEGIGGWQGLRLLSVPANETCNHEETGIKKILLWHSAILMVSILPALAVGILSLKRSVLMMGSDQDIMWASEAMRLLRGAGPSYADHPGAFTNGFQPSCLAFQENNFAHQTSH